MSSNDLKTKCYTSLKQILQKCLHIEALGALLFDAPSNILKYVLGQFSKVISKNSINIFFILLISINYCSVDDSIINNF